MQGNADPRTDHGRGAGRHLGLSSAVAGTGVPLAHATCRCCRSNSRSPRCSRWACCWCCCQARSTCRRAAVLACWRSRRRPCLLARRAGASRAAAGAWPQCMASGQSMGALIAIERVPAFIITLGRPAGISWPALAGDPESDRAGRRRRRAQNLYSLLTTFYLPPAAGYALAAAVVIASVARCSAPAHATAPTRPARRRR